MVHGKAADFLVLHRQHLCARCEMADAIADLIGMPDDDLVDVDRFDDYDGSFEIGNAPLGWKPTDAQVEACFDLGFERFWIKYVDGHEDFYRFKIKIS